MYLAVAISNIASTRHNIIYRIPRVPPQTFTQDNDSRSRNGNRNVASLGTGFLI